MAFDFVQNEKKWQARWKEARLFDSDVEIAKPKFMITFPYPYLNGAMHVGHSYSFFRADVYARFKRMQGFNVLFPQGFHATGEPIMGTVERIRKGDLAQIENFKKAGATLEDIEKFKAGPEFVARFWMERWISDLHKAGASIDWRRKFITTDLTPTYSRFIEWQYNTLRKKGYVVQGTHPVIWCPHDKSPTGDHDRYKGEGESPVEYTIIKFEMFLEGEKVILPCATLRPETLLGVTNLWLNPEGKYVKAKVDSEVWVLSDFAVLKMQDQQHDVRVLGELSAKELIGKNCQNKYVADLVPIYPAQFVDTSHATGVVMGVPGHAPYDYIALEDLRKDYAAIETYKLDIGILQALKPVSLIKVEGYGDFPAVEECKRLNITSQKDFAKLEEATQQIYKKEFHKGVLKDIYLEFSNLKVVDAKEKIAKKFKGEGIASSIYEPAAEVICRCMAKCHVKILENQWFLKFSDPEWKKMVLEHLEGMNIYPSDARLQMINTIDWLQNKACARKGGLGTKLPWDGEWKVETLSDSTIYMAYYTISRIINENDISADMLPDAVSDHIFLSKGSLDEVKLRTPLKTHLISQMKAEFEYFYPVDIRNSGKDLLQNHLLFFLFHHCAIFKKEHLPRGISVNGYVNVEGEKMSKSKGNFITVSELLDKFGADLVRVNIVASGEGLDDADWRNETLRTYARSLEALHEFASRLASGGFLGGHIGRDEKLLQSRLNSSIKNAQGHMEKLKFRSATHELFFEALDSLRKYIQTKDKDSDPHVVREALEKITLLIAPLTPHFSEEIWHLLGKPPFCAIEKYPSFDEAKISQELEEEEKYLRGVEADIAKILEITKAAPSEIRLFTAEDRKQKILKMSLEESARSGKFDMGFLIKKAVSDPELSAYAKKIPNYLSAISKTVNYYKSNELPKFPEFSLLERSSEMLSKRFACKILAIDAGDSEGKDPEGKAQKALPLKPAIYLVK